MRTIRIHSKMAIVVFFAVIVGAAGVVWWLLDSDTPTSPQQVIEDACTGLDDYEYGIFTAEGISPARWSMTIEFTPTEFRMLTYDEDGVMRLETIAITTAPPAGSRSTYGVTTYKRGRDPAGIEWGDWNVETLPGLPELSDNDFCGYSSDEISNIQYVGLETINEVTARHYTSTVDGRSWEIWVASDGIPVRTKLIDGSTVIVGTFSQERPASITAPVSTPDPEPATTPKPTAEPTVEPTSEPGETTEDASTPVPTTPPDPIDPPEPTLSEAWLEPDPETITFDGQWRQFNVGGNLADVSLEINVFGLQGEPISTGAIELTQSSRLIPAINACEDTYYIGFDVGAGDTIHLVGCIPGTVIIRLEDPANDYALLQEYTVTVASGP